MVYKERPSSSPMPVGEAWTACTPSALHQGWETGGTAVQGELTGRELRDRGRWRRWQGGEREGLGGGGARGGPLKQLLPAQPQLSGEQDSRGSTKT